MVHLWFFCGKYVAKGQRKRGLLLNIVELELLEKNTSPVCQGIPETNWKKKYLA